MYLGAHMSISGGLHRAIQLGDSINCGAIQLFTKNNNRWMSKELTEEEISLFKETWSGSGVKKIVAHTGYLINLANPTDNLQKSMDSMDLEIRRAEQLGIPYLVLHPGSHLGQGEKEGIRRISDSLNMLVGRYPDYKVKILLETAAGQGTNIGYKFEHIAEILEQVDDLSHYGVCFDTCHSFSAGYDLRSEEVYNQTFESFDKLIGLKYLEVIHLNDSKTGLGSRRDRHEMIGEGELGIEPFRLLMNDQQFKDIPMILETPKEDGLESDQKNLNILYSLIDK